MPGYGGAPYGSTPYGDGEGAGTPPIDLGAIATANEYVFENIGIAGVSVPSAAEYVNENIGGPGVLTADVAEYINENILITTIVPRTTAGPSAIDGLDLDECIGQRSASFVFELVETVSDLHKGFIYPDRGSPPSIELDTSRTIVRSMSSLHLDPADSLLVDPIKDQVRVHMLLANGQSFPLGRYVFINNATTVESFGRRIDANLAGMKFALDTPLLESFSVPVGESIGAAIVRLLREALLTQYVVEGSPAFAGAPMTWPAGTTRATVLDDLAAAGGYFRPWDDNEGRIRVIQAFDPADRLASLTYEPGGRINAGSLSEDDDLLEAPNRFIVIDNSVTTAPVVGTYDIPASARHSIANRGFVVADVSEIQGLGSNTTADEAAKARGLQHTRVERAEFSGPPDPRHDGWDVIRYDGRNWLELGWSMTLTEGGEMRHKLSRSYA